MRLKKPINEFSAKEIKDICSHIHQNADFEIGEMGCPVVSCAFLGHPFCPKIINNPNMRKV